MASTLNFTNVCFSKVKLLTHCSVHGKVRERKVMVLQILHRCWHNVLTHLLCTWQSKGKDCDDFADTPQNLHTDLSGVPSRRTLRCRSSSS